MRAALLTLCLVVIAGCKVKNPNYCEDTDQHLCDQPDAKPMMCEMSSDCTGPLKVCEMSECVECTAAEDAACTGMKPVCDMNACRACKAHTDCPDSNACLPDGSCAAAGDVAYLAPAGMGGTDNTNCTKTEKCTVFAKALATPRPYIKIEGTHTANIVIDRTVTILAEPTAKLGPNSGTIVTLNGTTATTIKIYDLLIDGGGNNTIGVAIPTGQQPVVTLDRTVVARNDGGGVIVNAGNITIQNSRIESNQGGGIQVTGAGSRYVITNSFIVTNGSDQGSPSVYGGASLVGNINGNKFEFNTVAFNRSDGTNAAGLDCNGVMATANGNIIYANQLPGNDVSMGAQQRGNCTLQTNLITGVNVGTAPDLGFQSPRTPPISFKLTANSPMQVKDVLMSGCPAKDFEGDARPTGTGCELGADELK